MKPAPFEYIRATALDDVFAAFSRFGDEARIIAGGQSLMPILNIRLASPEALVDINDIEELKGISVEGDYVRIGALTRHRELLSSPEIARHAPLFRLAAPYIAHPAIRNRGTFGGSISHADPAAELGACVVASGGRINVAGPNGKRTLDADGFFLGTFETELAEDEILTDVEIPVIGPGERVGFDELARRSGDYATVGLAARGRTDSGVIEDIWPVFFSVSDRPVMARKAAATLKGRAISDACDDDVLAALGEDLSETGDDLHTSAEGKRHMAGVLLTRVLGTMSREGGS